MFQKDKQNNTPGNRQFSGSLCRYGCFLWQPSKCLLSSLLALIYWL